ncbi:hypothetical protein LMG18095_02582 [Ralstonia thomasii]|uniref:Uncharacterized protein n=1 Tax=Ralstonia thomasii TaxID=3058596 RepID=A0ABM9JHS0_9RALS|nr:DUF692 domain-containing protein [Ralstonia sp. LMG 18095]CAJ0794291.1 hypothetical protein LMG18095_02582 [Ralstonia sp. LMG 18095]
MGLKPQHTKEVVETRPDVGFFEVHAENYMVDGGPFHHWLSRVREAYPLSIHGVGLSIGGEAPLDEAHLERLAVLLAQYEPESFSEHLAWSTHGDFFYNDLLPIRYDRVTLERICDHVDQVQERLKRRILLENPATYVEFAGNEFHEAEFIREVVLKTGCGLLLDLTNVLVSSVNHHRGSLDYLSRLPLNAVGEIHLAGFSTDRDANGAPLLIDDHGSRVCPTVWDLFRRTIAWLGPTPTLIEWDNNVPPLSDFLAEARHAERGFSRPLHGEIGRRA